MEWTEFRLFVRMTALLLFFSQCFRKFMMKLSTNSALDYEYMDMLKHIYENADTQV
jgi:hypothetical protein